LAKELGMTHAELLARCSSAELSEWQAYLQVDREETEQRRLRTEMNTGAAAGVQARKRRMRSR
jgi:hypothetical protein